MFFVFFDFFGFFQHVHPVQPKGRCKMKLGSQTPETLQILGCLTRYKTQKIVDLWVGGTIYIYIYMYVYMLIYMYAGVYPTTAVILLGIHSLKGGGSPVGDPFCCITDSWVPFLTALYAARCGPALNNTHGGGIRHRCSNFYSPSDPG